MHRSASCLVWVATSLRFGEGGTSGRELIKPNVRERFPDVFKVTVARDCDYKIVPSHIEMCGDSTRRTRI